MLAYARAALDPDPLDQQPATTHVQTGVTVDTRTSWVRWRLRNHHLTRVSSPLSSRDAVTKHVAEYV